MFQIYDIFEPSIEGKPAECGRDSHGSTSEIIQTTDGTIYISYTNKRGCNIRCVHLDENWIINGE
jgi:hypothetical protein